jgi:formamidopyrimidine-DNA glycosylase
MPELPEVETVCRGLRRANLEGPITSVWRSEKLLRTGAHWRRENLSLLLGLRPVGIRRRGKFVVWSFRGHSGPEIGLLVHLGMTGRLEVRDPNGALAEHTHLVLSFGEGREVRFVDPRRFGGLRVDPLDVLYASRPLRDLGPEPLEPSFDAELLRTRAGRSARAIRDVLLDQAVVAGLGNIYVLEALYRAKLHPLVAARRLRPSAWKRLTEAIGDVLRQGIRNGGTTFRDYRGADGRLGRNQAHLRVYGRAGQECDACGAILQGFVLGGRSGVYCPREQARSKGRWIL